MKHFDCFSRISQSQKIGLSISDQIYLARVFPKPIIENSQRILRPLFQLAQGKQSATNRIQFWKANQIDNGLTFSNDDFPLEKTLKEKYPIVELTENFESHEERGALGFLVLKEFNFFPPEGSILFVEPKTEIFSGSSKETYIDWIQTHPNYSWVILHGAGLDFNETLEFAKNHNVHLVLDSQPVENILKAIKTFPKRVLYGSAFPIHSHESRIEVLNQWQSSNLISKEQLEDFFYGNAKRLFKL